MAMEEHFMISEVIQEKVKGPDSVSWVTIVALLAVWFWMSCLFLGARPWASRGEPREALVAQSMWQSGNVILGQGYGGIVPSKPPVLHWSALLSSLPFGEVNEFSMRLPSALAALIVMLLVMRLSASIYPAYSPLLAPFLLASSLEFYRAGIEARVDMALCAAMFGALLALYRYLKSPSVMWGVCGGLLLGLAVLAKGPVGLVLPCGALTLFWWFEHRKFLRPFALIGPALFALAFGGIWYWKAYQVGGHAFFERVMYENVFRFLGTQEDQPHKHSAFYMIGMLLLGLMPWTFLILAKCCVHPRQWRQGFLGWYKDLPEVARLLVWWSAIVLLFFCIPASKRGVYLLPMYPALAVLLVPLLARVSSQNAMLRFRTWLAIVLALIASIGLALSSGVLSRVLSDAAFANEKIQILLNALSTIAHASQTFVVLQVILLCCAWLLFMKRRVQNSLQIIIIWCVALGVIHGGLLSTWSNWLSAKPFAEQLKTELTPSDRLLSYNHEFYGISFYLGRSISRLEEVTPAIGDVVLTYEENRQRLQARGILLEFVARSIAPIDEPFKTVLALRVVDANLASRQLDQVQ